MKMKKIRRLLATLLIILSFSLTVLAADTEVKVTIDLSSYPKAMNVNEYIEGDETNSSIPAKTKEVRTYDAADDVVITLYPSTEMPVSEWEINGERYTLAADESYKTIEFEDKYVTVSIRQTSFEIAIQYPEMDEEWIIKPIVAAASEIEAKVETSDPEQGSAAAVKQTAENTYELKATANPGYSFDHWVAAITQEEITQNPYTVTLTASETYTACFHSWK